MARKAQIYTKDLWHSRNLMLSSHQRRMPRFKSVSKALSYSKKYHDILSYVTLDAIGYAFRDEVFPHCDLLCYALNYTSIKPRLHSALRLDHDQNPSKSNLPWRRRCCSRWCRVWDELQSIYRRGRTRGVIRTALDAVQSFELLKRLAHGQPQVAHVVKTCNARETHVIIRVSAVIKT
jgi:hypothetical protein